MCVIPLCQYRNVTINKTVYTQHFIKVIKKATCFGCVKTVMRLRISEVRKQRNHIAIAIHSIVNLRVRSRPYTKCLTKSHLGNIFTLHSIVKHYYALIFSATVLKYFDIMYKCFPNVISTFYVRTRSRPLHHQMHGYSFLTHF